MTGPLSPRGSYDDIRLYAPDRRTFAIDLSDNTNRWGAPPSAMKAFHEAADGVAARYPTGYSEDLKVALAAYAGVEPNMIVTGCGSDDIIDLSMRAFAEPGDVMAMIEPSFVMVATFARMNGLRPVGVPLTPGYDLDADALVAANARVTYMCSPNNPTGGALTRSAIESVLERTTGLVIIDEAYAEFAGTSAVDLVARYPRLLVARTLSKAFGLAGIRVGYGICAPGVALAIEKSRGPYKVSAIAERAALAAFTHDLPWVREHVALAIESREALTTALCARGVNVAPSAANFVFAPMANAKAVAESMRALGVSVRDFGGLPRVSPGLEESGGAALRISVGPMSEINAMLAAFDQARAACA